MSRHDHGTRSLRSAGEAIAADAPPSRPSARLDERQPDGDLLHGISGRISRKATAAGSGGNGLSRRLEDFGERIEGARKHSVHRTPKHVPAASVPRFVRPSTNPYFVATYDNGRTWSIFRRVRGGSVCVALGNEIGTDPSDFLLGHRDELDATWACLREAAHPIERRLVQRERIGPPVRWSGDPNALRDRFGLRGVQFGNWVPQRDRREHVHSAFEALADLADALHIKPIRLGLGGPLGCGRKLGLAFGARGTGGAVAATYEPAHRAINLTRRTGAGALAHEWGHALDHALSGSGGLASSKAGGPWSTRPIPARSYQAEVTRVLKPLPKPLRMLAFAVLHSPVYARSCEADRFRSSRYYSTLGELIARAVESVVVVALADEGGRRNDYLVNVHEESPVHASADEARPWVPIVRALVRGA